MREYTLYNYNKSGYNSFKRLPKAESGMSFPDDDDNQQQDSFMNQKKLNPSIFTDTMTAFSKGQAAKPATSSVDPLTTPSSGLSAGVGVASKGISAIASLYQPKSLDPGLGNTSYFSRKAASHKSTDQFVNTAASAASAFGPPGAAIGAGLEIGNGIYKYLDSHSSEAKKQRNMSINNDASTRNASTDLQGAMSRSLIGGYQAPAYGKRGMKMKASKYSKPC